MSNKRKTPEELAAENAIHYDFSRHKPARSFAQVTGHEFAVRTCELPVSSVVRSPYQPRLQVDREHIESLAESIKASRQIEPILVRQIAEDQFELIAGEHRLEAFKLLNRDTILATVRQVSDAEAEIAALVDNIKRKNIADYEAGKCFVKLIKSGQVTSASEMARVAGVARQTVYRCMALAELPGEVTDILDQHPFALGGHAGEAIKALIEEGYGEHIVPAVNAVVAGTLKQKDLDGWVRTKARGPVRPAARPTFSTAGNRIQASVQTKGNKIRFDLSCDKSLSPEAIARVEAAIRDAIANIEIPDDTGGTVTEG